MLIENAINGTARTDVFMRYRQLNAEFGNKAAAFISVFVTLLMAFSVYPAASIAAKPQAGPDTLALVNGKPITGEEFRARFEMSLYPGKDDPTMLARTKREFLYSMIAERLLSQAALRSSAPTTPAEELVKKEMQDIFMRDALFRKVVMPYAKVTKQEILHGFKISIYKYTVDAFYFTADKSTAWSFYYASHGKGAPSIYDLAKELHVRHDTLEIPYGESTAAIENAFFGHERGFISKPTPTVDGLVVFRVLGRQLNQYFIKGSLDARWERIRQILVSRKQSDLGNEYIEEVMRNIVVHVNYDIFRPLVYDIQKIFEHQKRLATGRGYQLYPQDLVKLGEDFSAELKEPFLTFPGGDLTLSQVFQRLPMAMFVAGDTSLPAITFALHSSLRFISQNHFLVQEARKLGLQNSHEVKYNVDMVLRAFRSHRMANGIMDTVTVNEQEVNTYFTKHHDEILKAVKLKLRISVTKNINEAIAIYDKLNKEKGKRSARGETAANWVDAYNLGEIGAVLSELKDGDVYGPVEDHGKFYLYQLLDKRLSINNSAVKNSIAVARRMLLTEEQRETLDKYIAKRAEKENVKVFWKRVMALQVTPLQMLTFRFMGFGGKILAVPQLYPRAGWVKYFRPNIVLPAAKG